MLRRLLSRLISARPGAHTRSTLIPRAIAARAAGDLDTCESLLREALEEEASAPACALLADLLSTRGRDAEARAVCERALELDPRQPELRLKYALLLERCGALDAAERECERVIRERPDWAPACAIRGSIASARSRWREALAFLQRAVELAPEMVEARVNLATVLKQVGRARAAAGALDAALALAPGHGAALKNLATLHHEMGDHEQARSAFARRGAAGNDGARIAQALALPHILESNAHIDEVRARLRENLDHLREARLAIDDPVSEIGVTAFYLAYHGRNDRAFQEAIAMLHLQACPALAMRAQHCAGARGPAGARIRVGLVSSHLYNHSIGRVVEGLVEKLDRTRFEIRVFAFQPPFDEISRSLARAADVFSVVPRELRTARSALADHALDVLFYPDIGMDPLTYFLAFSRLAPVQCTTWGHPVTTGIPTIDYFVSTDLFEPEEASGHYSEKLVRLREVALPGYYRPPRAPGGAPRAALGFSKRRTYFCPQALFKFHPDFDAILAGILRADAGGEIVIAYDEDADAFRRPRLEARLRRAAPDVADRIVFVRRTDTREGYLQRLQACDVVLDTIHYCGGNTSLEALSLGAPVVTLPSGFNRGRHTYAFFRRMELDETIAGDPIEYVERAVKIATDREFQSHLRAKQSERVAMLWEDAGALDQFAQFLERACVDAPDA